jgi:YfiH family protein
MRIRSTTLSECAGIAHGFFTREGGVSGGIYASLNLGAGSQDDPQKVAENRIRVEAEIGGRLVTQYQVHSAKVVTVTSGDEREEADAMVTATPGLALGILTADCGPVLFADAQAGVIGAAHAGWKGAHGGVLENTVSAMEALGATRNHITAAIGPCIAQASYEVGPEFREKFTQADAAFFQSSPRAGHYLFDLAGYIRMKLHDCGLHKMDCLAMDTYEDEARFFSFRRTTHRGEPDYGRQVSVIVLN